MQRWSWPEANRRRWVALRSIFERRSDARSGLPLVQLAIALQKMGDQPRADQALVAGLAAKRKADQWLGDQMGSSLRDQALRILALLEENNLMSGQREQRLFICPINWRRVSGCRPRNAIHCSSPCDLLGKPEACWSAQLTSGDQTRELNNARSGLKLDGPLLASPLSLRNAGSAPIYQQLTISGYPQHASAWRAAKT